MMSHSLRICTLALGFVLFSWQPAMAGCGQLCGDGVNCEDTPAHPDWGCFKQTHSCLDFWCSPSASFDQVVLGDIEKAALAGDTNTVALLAASIGQPFRLYSQGKVVYDGFAMAGLTGPGSSASSDRLAACGSKALPPAEAPADQAAAAATDR